MGFHFSKYILIVIRITAFIVVSPIISMKGIPNAFKLGLSGILALFIYMGLPEMEGMDNLLILAFLSFKEVVLGLAMGYVTSLVFATMDIAGQFVDFQSGFSMSKTFDPIMGINAGNYGSTYYWIGVCAFFILDLHHKLIETLIRSFEYIPLGQSSLSGLTVEAVLTMFSRIFELAFNLAVPMIVVALVVDVVLGVISRTIPQINVLMLGMPLKQMVSYLVMLVSISWLLREAGTIISLLPHYLDGFLKLLST
ncbi:MAG: flagellar biosynthetic protein FliR [Tissierellia bacterium]|jgi:flagellar biosynthetic protein FliR|nr:flagellar biosynthetic protein FliR [Tissierellia bacterium]